MLQCIGGFFRAPGMYVDVGSSASPVTLYGGRAEKPQSVPDPTPLAFVLFDTMKSRVQTKKWILRLCCPDPEAACAKFPKFSCKWPRGGASFDWKRAAPGCMKSRTRPPWA